MEHFIQVEATCAKCQRSQSDTIEKQKPFCKLETKHCVIFALSMYLIWSNIMFHARLKDNELQLADLQQRLDMLSESYQNNNAPNTQETNEIVPNETTEDTELSRQLSTYIFKQANTFPAAMMKSAQSLRTKREAKTKKKDRKRRSKKCKNCLPATQVEGTAGMQNNIDKADQESFWTVSPWARTSPDKSYFNMDDVDRTGRIHVLQSGIYIVYAQMTLVGCTKQGFHVNVRTRTFSKQGWGSFVLATCSKNIQLDGTCSGHELSGDSCQIFRIVRLNENDSVYVEEAANNSGVDFSDTTSYFGLIRISE